jgi:hypothetical protein
MQKACPLMQPTALMQKDTILPQPTTLMQKDTGLPQPVTLMQRDMVLLQGEISPTQRDAIHRPLEVVHTQRENRPLLMDNSLMQKDITVELQDIFLMQRENNQ